MVNSSENLIEKKNLISTAKNQEKDKNSNKKN